MFPYTSCFFRKAQRQGNLWKVLTLCSHECADFLSAIFIAAHFGYMHAPIFCISKSRKWIIGKSLSVTWLGILHIQFSKYPLVP